jgi:hypothetical protein
VASWIDCCSCDSCLAAEKVSQTAGVNDPLFVIHVQVAGIQKERLVAADVILISMTETKC